MLVYLVVFDKTSFGLSQKLFKSIDEYIDEHYVEEVEVTFHRRQDQFIIEQMQEPKAESEDFYAKQMKSI
jgi:O-acetyl-ADP-ribose deacetylase